MKTVTLVSDGSCLGNPGSGGWACILRCGEAEKQLTGGEPRTSNNRMELLAVISGFAALKEPCLVQVVTDSEYVRKGITEHIRRWQTNGWRTANKSEVKNRDLWEKLLQLVKGHEVEWMWVRGHANHPDQNRCDGLARGAAHHQAALIAIESEVQVR